METVNERTTRGGGLRRIMIGSTLVLLLILSLPLWGAAVLRLPAKNAHAAQRVSEPMPQAGGDNPDHPAGNVNELTLAGLRPGRSTLHEAVRHFGAHWLHPTPQETDLYLWSDPARHLLISVEVNRQGEIRVVSVTRTDRDTSTPSALPVRAETTGRGVRLGDTEQKLRHVYGKPFFEGPSSLGGHDVHLIVYNFSWAGAGKPQILESSFDSTGHLVKMTLSADYY